MSVDLAWPYFKHMECCKTTLLSLALHVVVSSTKEKKDEKKLILVTRAEADVLREKAPNAHIAIVNRGHRNKKYYAEESREAKRAIGELRGTWKPREEKWKRRPRRPQQRPQQWSK